MSKHCISGVRHEGNPEGRFDIVGGVKCYLATPTVDYPNEKVTLFLSDMFGIEFVNNQAGTFNLSAWLPRHGTDVTRPRIDNVIAALKRQGIKEFAATGYCFGARYVFDLAFDGVIKAAAISHPFGLIIPQDLHRFKQTRVPLLVNSCEFDQMFPLDAGVQADAILGGGLTETDLYKREYFEGCAHGFAVRGDMSNPKVKAGKEGAFRATVEFFLEHF